MIIYRRTSLLESPAQTLVNTVNCVGVMGKGLAHEFKKRDGEMFKEYKEICDKNLLEPGKLFLWKGTDNWILNFPTKKHWRSPSKLDWIESGLEKFVATYEASGIREISFPRLGCGNGGLEWNDVRSVMEKYLSKVSIPVFIHDFSVDIGIPEHLAHFAQNIHWRSDNTAVDFETFLSSVEDVVSSVENGLVEICSERPFLARFDAEERCLFVEDDKAKWKYDLEDLHGTWVSLLRGLVTRERVEWSSGGGGDCVLTIMSLLPQTRPVEIQRSDQAELAVELLPELRQIGLASSQSKQMGLQWH